MIGARRRRSAAAIGVAGIALAAALFALRPADPRLADPVGRSAVALEFRARAGAAVAGLEALSVGLTAPLSAARRAAGRAAAGDDDAPIVLDSAATAVDRRGEELAAARRLVERAERIVACTWAPDAAFTTELTGERLRDAATALRGAAAGAGGVAALRRGADDTINGLAATLEALERDDLGVAREAHDAAAEAFAEMERAARELAGVAPTASVWFETTRSLPDGAGRMIDGLSRNDPDEVEAGRQLYQAAAENARLADRALAIGLAEASAALVDPAIVRLARLVASVDEMGDSLGSVADGSACR